MKYVAIAGLAVLGIVATGRPASAQSVGPDFDKALLSIASPASQIVTAGTVATEGIATPEGVEGPEGTERAEGSDGAEGPEGPDGVEGPETPGDMGPDIDHQFEGQETGENGAGISGPRGRS
jgi:hypothetical protein